jgi:hypothetical protein
VQVEEEILPTEVVSSREPVEVGNARVVVVESLPELVEVVI